MLGHFTARSLLVHDTRTAPPLFCRRNLVKSRINRTALGKYHKSVKIIPFLTDCSEFTPHCNFQNVWCQLSTTFISSSALAVADAVPKVTSGAPITTVADAEATADPTATTRALRRAHIRDVGPGRSRRVPAAGRGEKNLSRRSVCGPHGCTYGCTGTRSRQCGRFHDFLEFGVRAGDNLARYHPRKRALTRAGGEGWRKVTIIYPHSAYPRSQKPARVNHSGIHVGTPQE